MSLGMSETMEKRAAEVLLENARPVLIRCGFIEKSKKWDLVDGLFQYFFHQDKEWIIQFVRIKGKKDSGRIGVSLGLDLPIKTATGDGNHFFHGVELPIQEASNNSGYRVPTFLVSDSKLVSFANKISGEIEKSLSWFNGFKEPIDCLRHIENVVASTRKGKEAKWYQMQHAYFESLMQKKG